MAPNLGVLKWFAFLVKNDSRENVIKQSEAHTTGFTSKCLQNIKLAYLNNYMRCFWTSSLLYVLSVSARSVVREWFLTISLWVQAVLRH